MPDVDEQHVAHGHVEAAAALAKRLGKTPVVKGPPGFAVNLLLGRDTRSTLFKLHDLMLPHLAMREKSVDSFGPAQNAAMENYVVERLRGVLRGWPPA
jgi:hypothetical protein